MTPEKSVTARRNLVRQGYRWLSWARQPGYSIFGHQDPSATYRRLPPEGRAGKCLQNMLQQIKQPLSVRIQRLGTPKCKIMETKSFFTESACLIEQGNIAIFKIPSQTAKGDKMSLLSLQNIVRRNVRNYVYLEVGSFMGGTLLPHLADPECRLAYSIDKRPASQPDERGRSYDYVHSSTQEMLATLEKHLPHAAMLKLLTFDLDASEITADHVALESDFVFIDAEHTNQAAFRDFLHICRFAKESSIIAFHDAQYIFDALSNIEMLLTYQKVKHKVYVIPDSVFAVLLGDFVDLAANVLSRFSLDKETYFSNARKELWKEIARNNALPVAGEA
jgi:hypothetical protein